ncbi:MAG: 4-(cytidine 5'-diphospho)-2-C-methyl-D-erythritol kinase [Clostridia bacterium]|nr:4-(cytidine 5'-diphospho)-2-C-methyl-D-erythritol kinase [Clostridia bacterium]
MKELTLLTPAKINLSIDVTSRLDNGYHTVEMIMQAVSLYDTVTVEKTKSNISVCCAQPYVPNDSRNIAWKAAEAFFSECPEKGGANILIKKNIPVAAGLAGGSTNAAGVLKALNMLYGSHLSDIKLNELCRKLGADVAFCLKGGTQLARGIGDELTVLPDFAGVHVVLVKPAFPVSTPWVYKNLRLDRLGERPHTSALLNAIEEFDVHCVAKGMRNVLESVTTREYPEISRLMQRFTEYGALGTRMSGSGPTVFGIFADESAATRAKENFLKDYENVFYVQTISREEE